MLKDHIETKIKSENAWDHAQPRHACGKKRRLNISMLNCVVRTTMYSQDARELCKAPTLQDTSDPQTTAGGEGA